jgi:CheY-like chemotaxis protein
MKRHVLVIEDDPQNALLFRKVLEKHGGFRVSVTEDPEELTRLAKEGVDLVVMDVSLHNSRYRGEPVNGVQLCRLLKSDPATSGVPVLLATAHAMRGDAGRLLAESGADDYVAKPIVDHAAFVAQIRALLKEAA